MAADFVLVFTFTLVFTFNIQIDTPLYDQLECQHDRKGRIVVKNIIQSVLV